MWRESLGPGTVPSTPTPPASAVQADKWRIAHNLGIQARDLRLLDPNLSSTYPPAILCRDKVGSGSSWAGRMTSMLRNCSST